MSGVRAEEEYRFTEAIYAPARIVISYSWCDNATLPIRGTVNHTLSFLESSQISTTFTADGVDVFFFSLQLSYPTRMRQTILVDVFSGNEQRQSHREIPVREQNNTVLYFDIIVAEQPHFPSVDEIWANQPIPTKQDFNEMQAWIQQKISTTDNNQIVQWGLIALSGGENLLMLMIVLRRRGKSD